MDEQKQTPSPLTSTSEDMSKAEAAQAETAAEEDVAARITALGLRVDRFSVATVAHLIRSTFDHARVADRCVDRAIGTCQASQTRVAIKLSSA